MGLQEFYEVEMLNNTLPTLDLAEDRDVWDWIFNGWFLDETGEYLVYRNGLQQRGYYMRYFDDSVRQLIYDYYGFKIRA